MHTTGKAMYGRLESRRNVFLERARESALLTIPTIMPREGFTDASKIRTPYQSIGARGVNNLAAKLQMALFPPNQSFFRLTVDDYTIAENQTHPTCLLYTSPSPRDRQKSRMPSSA